MPSRRSGAEFDPAQPLDEALLSNTAGEDGRSTREGEEAPAGTIVVAAGPNTKNGRTALFEQSDEHPHRPEEAFGEVFLAKNHDGTSERVRVGQTPLVLEKLARGELVEVDGPATAERRGARGATVAARRYQAPPEPPEVPELPAEPEPPALAGEE